MKSGQQKATVIGAFSRRMRLRLEDGHQVEARIKGKKLKPVCGDEVRTAPIPGEPDWLITSIDPRQNELTRPDRRGRVEVLAANLTCVVVVAAVEPKPDWFVVDRYLAATENMCAKALIAFNKVDLPGRHAFDEALNDYRACDYTVLECSAAAGIGLDTLADKLIGEAAIIVGQSGVGKSTIINALADDAMLRTAEISGSTGEGRHTTVNSMMVELPGGGVVIDSPGVRDYAPAIASEDEVASGFREVALFGQQCRFANCRHLREPDCAVKQAVDDGAISARRYESYRRLLSIVRDLAARQN